MDEVSAGWVAELSGHGPARDSSIARLHVLLQRIAHLEAIRRSGMNGISGQELEDLADQAASDAVVSVLRRIGDFRGESRFTTWAYKFVVFEVSSKFGRHAWRRHGIPFDGEVWERLPGRLGVDPELVSESRELLAAVREAVDQQLTSHQRRVFVAIIVHGVALDELVIELDSNRNAIYKTLFDARRKLRGYLEDHGFLDRDEASM
ncbi:MAG: sigma-70 family RNA polymerase sigma factor [Nocardioidaceae bacterium]